MIGEGSGAVYLRTAVVLVLGLCLYAVLELFLWKRPQEKLILELRQQLREQKQELALLRSNQRVFSTDRPVLLKMTRQVAQLAEAQKKWQDLEKVLEDHYQRILVLQTRLSTIDISGQRQKIAELVAQGQVLEKKLRDLEKLQLHWKELLKKLNTLAQAQENQSQALKELHQTLQKQAKGLGSLRQNLQRYRQLVLDLEKRQKALDTKFEADKKSLDKSLSQVQQKLKELEKYQALWQKGKANWQKAILERLHEVEALIPRLQKRLQRLEKKQKQKEQTSSRAQNEIQKLKEKLRLVQKRLSDLQKVKEKLKVLPDIQNVLEQIREIRKKLEQLERFLGVESGSL